MTIRIGALQFAADVGANAANKLKAAGLVTMCYSTFAMTHIVCEFVSQPEIMQMVQTALIPTLSQAVQAVKSGSSPIFGSSYLSIFGTSIGTMVAASTFSDMMDKAKAFISKHKLASQDSLHAPSGRRDANPPSYEM